MRPEWPTDGCIGSKKASTDPILAQDQGIHYADQLQVPFVFLSNGEEVRFLDRDTDAHSRKVAGFYTQDDLERRIAVRQNRRETTTVTIDQSIVDRDYQIKCVEILSTEISRGRRKLLVEMATGAGKTRTAAAFIKRLFEAGRITRVLFLVDRIELARQAEDSYVDYLNDYPCHVLRPKRGFDRAKRITIATLQTMISDYRDLSTGYFDLVITDECHRSIYGKYSNVLRHFDGIQLGLTATPCTMDIQDLPDPEDGRYVRDTLRFFELEEPTFRYTLQEAIDDGHLVPYSIYRALTVKTASEDGFEVRRDELDWTTMDDSSKKEFESLFVESESVLVDPNALERKFTIPERNRAIVREFRDVLDNGFTDENGTHKPDSGKTIVFAVTRRHATTLAQMFDEHFADKKPIPTTRFADFVVSDVGKASTRDVNEIIRKFKNEKYPQILVSVNMLDTGFDCPEVVNLVMARFTRSNILYRQMRGRGTRQARHIGKRGFTIFDFVNVANFHNDTKTKEGGFVTSVYRNQPSGDPTTLLTLDVDDHIDPESRDWMTLDDDGRIVHTPEHQARATQIGLRFEEWRNKQDHFTAEQSRWLGIIGSTLKANALSTEPLGDWNFSESPFQNIGGFRQACRVFEGEHAVHTLLQQINLDVLKFKRAELDSTTT